MVDELKFTVTLEVTVTPCEDELPTDMQLIQDSVAEAIQSALNLSYSDVGFLHPLDKQIALDPKPVVVTVEKVENGT